MKNYLILISLLFSGSVLVQAQPKFGHINIEEVVHLMPARDSAMLVYQKYVAEMQEVYEGIQVEYRTKMNEYQQKSASWTATILESKERELYDIQQRLEQYGQSASQEMQTMQSALFTPLYNDAKEAVQNVAKEFGLIYVFDSVGMPYIDEEQSINLMDRVKAALKIPAEKVAPTIIGQ